MKETRSRKWFVYGGIIVVLLAMNLGPRPQTASDTTTPVVQTAWVETSQSELNVARDLETAPTSVTRDLFLRPNNTPVPVAAPVARPALPQSTAPDPRAIAQAQAERTMNDIRLIGVMKAGDDLVAMIEHDGQTMSLRMGQPVLPGFVISEITTEGVRIDHTPLGLAGVFVLRGNGEIELIGLDG